MAGTFKKTAKGIYKFNTAAWNKAAALISGTVSKTSDSVFIPTKADVNNYDTGGDEGEKTRYKQDVWILAGDIVDRYDIFAGFDFIIIEEKEEGAGIELITGNETGFFYTLFAAIAKNKNISSDKFYSLMDSLKSVAPDPEIIKDTVEPEKSFFQKNKTILIVAAAAVIGFFAYKKFGKKLKV